VVVYDTSAENLFQHYKHDLFVTTESRVDHASIIDRMVFTKEYFWGHQLRAIMFTVSMSHVLSVLLRRTGCQIQGIMIDRTCFSEEREMIWVLNR